MKAVLFISLCLSLAVHLLVLGLWLDSARDWRLVGHFGPGQGGGPIVVTWWQPSQVSLADKRKSTLKPEERAKHSSLTVETGLKRGSRPATGVDSSGRSRTGLPFGGSTQVTFKQMAGWGNRPPLYPAEALEWGWEGTSKLWLSVDREGLVKHVRLLQSSGYALLDQEAVRVARSWTIPKSRSPVVLVVPIQFQMVR